MALTQEEIRIKMGVDATSIKSGLASVGGMITKFAGSIQGQLIAAFSARAIVTELKEVVDYVEKLDNQSSALGISKSFLQDVQNLGLAAGRSSQEIAKLLNTFAKTLPEGSNVEEEFFKFLDVIKQTEDPVKRLQIAFEKLGKSGVVLLDFAKDGSDAFKELSKQMDKLSDAEIKNILKADAFLDRLENRLKILKAKTVLFLQDLFEADSRRDLSDEVGEWNAIEIIRQERRIAEMKEELERKAFERAKKRSEEAKKFESTPTDIEVVESLREDIGHYEEEMEAFLEKYKGNEPLGDLAEHEEGYRDFLEANLRKSEALKKILEIAADRKAKAEALAQTGMPHTNDPLEDVTSPNFTNPQLAPISNYYKKISESAAAYGNKSDAEKYKKMSEAFYKAQKQVVEEKPMAVIVKGVEL